MPSSLITESACPRSGPRTTLNIPDNARGINIEQPHSAAKSQGLIDQRHHEQHLLWIFPNTGATTAHITGLVEDSPTRTKSPIFAQRFPNDPNDRVNKQAKISTSRTDLEDQADTPTTMERKPNVHWDPTSAAPLVPPQLENCTGRRERKDPFPYLSSAVLRFYSIQIRLGTLKPDGRITTAVSL